jgi:hypothetical protein
MMVWLEWVQVSAPASDALAFDGRRRGKTLTPV